MPIQVLPPQLANQIAAGEVVERPASVVKELVENSIDAGASRIDIDIERGGAKRICIRDNGCGIRQQELPLALARHATSKIASLDDLEAIMSLGFRGEALASISSVARLTLTSRTEEQDEAWQAYAEGRDQQVTVKPAAHPVGTTLDVLDLFFNTPARRKFMRTEKTEFNHIDEVVRRIALARPDVSFTLQHNGKLIRQYRAAQVGVARERRLAAICGTAFMEHAVAIEWLHGDLALEGWVAAPKAAGSGFSDIQYCYVNGRMMRDKLINHAIRQAFDVQGMADDQPAFVLYLQVDPHQVDVNVHPAKHEVRFHQSRLVHDFIYQGVLSALSREPERVSQAIGHVGQPLSHPPENRVAAGRNQFTQPVAPREAVRPAQGAPSAVGEGRTPLWPHAVPGYQKKQTALYQQLLDTPEETVPAVLSETPPSPLESHQLSFGRVLSLLAGDMALLEQQGRLLLLSLPVAERMLREKQILPSDTPPRPQPLLIPLRMQITQEEKAVLMNNQSLIHSLGIEFAYEEHQITISAVPLPLRKQNLQILIHELTRYLTHQTDVTVSMIATFIASHLTSEHEHWSQAQAIALLADVERLCPHLVTSPPAALLQYLDIQPALNALQHD